MEGIFLDLTLVLVLAAAFGLLTHLLRQPPLLGYILTGILVGSAGFLAAENEDIIRTLAEAGITLLLFMVGLEMSIKDLKSVGVAALVTGIGQIVFTTSIGVAIAQLLGFSLVASLYIALAVAFSSTIIVVKLLSQKQDLDSLYGKVAVGFLLVQDFVAIVALVLLSALSPEHLSLDLTDIGLVVGKGLILFAGVILLSQTLIPYLVDRLARSQELLFITSLAWAFGIAALTASPPIGFSIEIGGFLAGLALANSAEHLQIASRIRPLRDFFIVIFFVLLGMQLGFGSASAVAGPALVFSGLVIIGNPLIVLILMTLLKFRRRTSFLAGLTVAQISEFSLILVALGVKLGHLDSSVMTMMTLIALITMTFSAYLILSGDRIYGFLRPLLKPFQRSTTIEGSLSVADNLTGHTVLIGGHRTAENIIKALEKKDARVVVVDFDPQVVERLNRSGVPVIFGDISDPDIRDQAKLGEAKLVISTVTDPGDTRRLLEDVKGKHNISVIVTAQDAHEARDFYKLGADYVLLPHFISGEHIADIILDERFGERLSRLKEKHTRRLSENHFD